MVTSILKFNYSKILKINFSLSKPFPPDPTPYQKQTHFFLNSILTLIKDPPPKEVLRAIQ